MKKAPLLVLTLVAASACGKHNEVAVLHHEAIAAAQFYAPQLDRLQTRMEAIFKRGQKIPASTPGVDVVGGRLSEAKDILGQLKGIVSAGADGKSAVEKSATDAAKNNRVGDLEKIVHDTHTTLERGISVMNDDLQTVEAWLAYYDGHALTIPAQRQVQPPMDDPNDPNRATTPTPEGAPAGGTPAGGAPTGGAPAGGTPAPAAGRGSAAPAPARGSAAPTHP